MFRKLVVVCSDERANVFLRVSREAAGPSKKDLIRLGCPPEKKVGRTVAGRHVIPGH